MIEIQEFEGWLVLKLNVFGTGSLYMVENIFYVELSQSRLAFYIFFTLGINANLPSVGSIHTVAAVVLLQMSLHVFADENSSRISTTHFSKHRRRIQHDVRNETDFALVS